jgi:hypothetical protein
MLSSFHLYLFKLKDKVVNAIFNNRVSSRFKPPGRNQTRGFVSDI